MNNTKRLSVGALVMCFALLGAAFIGSTADAKKKKVKVATPANTIPRAIPDRSQGTPATIGKLATPLTVGKKFKGKRVGEVFVTVQTVGATPTSANDLAFKLTAPNGRTVDLASPFSGQSIGPLTWTANSPFGACFGFATPPPPPCSDPDAVLNAPYIGTIGEVNLALFEGVKMRGTWYVSVYDVASMDTSTLNSVSLKIKPATTN